MDDLIGIAPTEKELDDLEKSIEATVELEKRGKPRKLLGMELTWKKDEVILTQKLLIENMEKTYPQNHGGSGKKGSLPIDDELFKAPDPELDEALNDQEKK